MVSAPDPRLQRLLGGEALAALRRRLRQRYERADAATPPHTLRLTALGEAEHAALAALQGRRAQPGGSIQLDLAFIDTALRAAGIAHSLRDALEQLDGVIVHTASARAAMQARWAAVADAGRHPNLVALLRTAAGLGLLKRLARADPALALRCAEQADAVLQRLSAPGLPRAQLAAETLGDAHALDDGQPTAALVLAALRGSMAAVVDPRANPPFEPEPELDLDADANAVSDAEAAFVRAAAVGPVDPGEAYAPAAAAERNRNTWARAGVLVNELARPALFLNLPTHGTHAGLDGLAAPGEPAYASLRRLLRNPPAWDVRGRAVFVCENPNLLAIAADRLGAACAPLVCTEGMPAAAQRSMLDQLAEAGARLRCHADFDWAGLRIVGHLLRRHGAEAWRFSSSDYEAAARRAPRPGQTLSGAAVPTPWDPELATVMQRVGITLAEEALATDLLTDLAT